jgi:nucleotide-binding universal stress UspA family protein
MSDPVLVGVALDERDAAPLALGRTLAALTTGRLALLHAYPYEPLTMRAPAYGEGLRRQAADGVEQLAASLAGDLEVTVHTYPRISVARALHEAAQALRAVALVVGSSRGGTLGRVLPGRTAERLLGGAPCPMAISPNEASGRAEDVSRIGAAFDGTPESDDALETAIALARAADAKVTTYTVFEPIDTAPAFTAPGWVAPQSYLEDYRERAERTARTAAQRVPEDLLGATRLLTGDAALVLSDVSSEVDLMLCGSRGYGPLRALLLGSVSARLVRNAACPLVITPRGHGGELAARVRASRTSRRWAA